MALRLPSHPSTHPSTSAHLPPSLSPLPLPPSSIHAPLIRPSKRQGALDARLIEALARDVDVTEHLHLAFAQLREHSPAQGLGLLRPGLGRRCWRERWRKRKCRGRCRRRCAGAGVGDSTRLRSSAGVVPSMCTAGTSASRSRAASSREAATLAQKATVRAPAARRIHMAMPASSSALPSALAPLGRTSGAKTRGVTWRRWWQESACVRACACALARGWVGCRARSFGRAAWWGSRTQKASSSRTATALRKMGPRRRPLWRRWRRCSLRKCHWAWEAARRGTDFPMQSAFTSLPLRRLWNRPSSCA